LTAGSCELSTSSQEDTYEAGLSYVKIVASGDLNEWKIEELVNMAQGSICSVWHRTHNRRPHPRLMGYTSFRMLRMGSISKMKLSEETVKSNASRKEKGVARDGEWSFCEGHNLLDDEIGG